MVGMTGDDALVMAKNHVKKTLQGAGALKGEAGASAYKIAVSNGFKGTEAEWLESLKAVITGEEFNTQLTAYLPKYCTEKLGYTETVTEAVDLVASGVAEIIEGAYWTTSGITENTYWCYAKIPIEYGDRIIFSDCAFNSAGTTTAVVLSGEEKKYLKAVSETVIDCIDAWGLYKAYTDMYLCINLLVSKKADFYVYKTSTESITEYNLEKVSPLKGKKINFLGDSFTETYLNDSSQRWWTYIVDRTGCIGRNYGKAGSAIMEIYNATIDSFIDRYSAMTDDADMVVIFGGINDANSTQYDTRPIGTIDDIYDETLTDSNNSFYASLKYLVEKLIEKYPTQKIVALLPPHLNRGTSDDTAIYDQRIDIICEAEKEVYTAYGIPFLDLRSASGISNTAAHVDLYFNGADNIHWNTAGHERASYPIQAFLESYF